MDFRPPAVVDGTEYHILISQPLLHSNNWGDDSISVAQYCVYLNNLGHGVFHCLSPVVSSYELHCSPATQQICEMGHPEPIVSPST